MKEVLETVIRIGNLQLLRKQIVSRLQVGASTHSRHVVDAVRNLSDAVVYTYRGKYVSLLQSHTLAILIIDSSEYDCL